MGCVGLTIAGGVFEILGFALVAYELYRIQRREFGEPEFLKRLQARLRKILRRSKDVTVESGAAVMTATVGGRAQGQVRRGPGSTLESRIDALEKNLQHLEAEIDQQNATFGGDIAELSKRLRETQVELAQERERSEEGRRAALRISVALQAWGTGLFVLGAILSILGNTITC
jgi:hypothetical protein